MKLLNQLLTLTLCSVCSLTAIAQTTGSEVQRNTNQQERIEQGLTSGELNTREAAKLEKTESRIDRTEAAAQKDGVVTDQEAARIKAEQNKASAAIYKQKHDGQTGNPDSASSQRMQRDVQRNANQQARIEQGVNSGSLTTQEAAKLERGQARESRREARAGANGHVGAAEQRNIQQKEDTQSGKIYRKKHNAKNEDASAQ